MSNNTPAPNVVYETDLYYVEVGICVSRSDYGGNLYKVINKQYNVAEVETTLLIRALWECDDLTAQLNIFNDTKNIHDVPASFSDDDLADFDLTLIPPDGNKKH